MQHISTKSSIMAANMDIHFEDIYQLSYYTEAYQEKIQKANLLLLPSENIRENLGPVFPEFTSDFFRYLQNHASPNVIVDIASDEEHYHQLLLHSSFTALPTLMIRDEILEETAGLVVGFLEELAEKNHRNTEEMDTFVNIFVDGQPVSKKIMFSGRVSELKDALNTTITKVFRG